MTRISVYVPVCALLLALEGNQVALGQAPNQGAAVVTVAGAQTRPVAVADGAGGAFVAWEDYRSGDPNYHGIYVQHLLPSGQLDEAWPVNGRVTSTNLYLASKPNLIADGIGGVFVTWAAPIGGAAALDIWLQHLLANGAVDPSWPTNGKVLSNYNSIYSLHPPALALDGADGVYVAWSDGSANIIAQRVTPAGGIAAGWPVVVCDAALSQIAPAMVGDGAGGILIAWRDERPAGPFVQRVAGTGSLYAAWPANGLGLGEPVGTTGNPVILGDDVGGALVSWTHTGAETPGIVVQRVTSGGIADPTWPLNGRSLQIASGANDLVAVGDGAGGALVVWSGGQAGSRDIFAHHVMADGTLDDLWPVDGEAVCDHAYDQFSPAATSDGAGGAIIAWQDLRMSAEGDIFAQHLLASGVVDPSWTPLGQAICTERASQALPAIVPGPDQGAYIIWQDERRGEADVYAQHVGIHGNLTLPDSDRPHLEAVFDVPADQGGRVLLKWKSPLDGPGNALVTGFRVWRRIPAGGVAIANAGSDGDAGAQAINPRLDMTGQQDYWESIAVLPAEQLVNYGFTAGTHSDSLSPEDNPYTAFFVTALTADPTIFYQSNIDSGFSVDNLAPPAPPSFVARYEPNGTALHWTPSRGPDVSHYRLHRGLAPNFTPNATTMLLASPDTGYFDNTMGAEYFYKLAAVDIHGNVSRYAMVSPGEPTAALATLVSSGIVDGRVRLRWYLSIEETATLTVYRRELERGWTALSPVEGDGTGYAAFEDADVQAGVRYGYRLGIRPTGAAEAFSNEVWIDAPLSTADMRVVVPNPVVAGSIDVSLAVPGAQAVSIQLFDLAGRMVGSRRVSGGTGRQTISLAKASDLSPGVYLVRVGFETPVVLRVAVVR